MSRDELSDQRRRWMRRLRKTPRSARVLDEYLAGLEAGRPADPERLLAEHPAIAAQLRACLEVMNLADRVADGSRPGSRHMGRPRVRLDRRMPQAQSVLIDLGRGTVRRRAFSCMTCR